MKIGDQAPSFSLPDTDGQDHGPDGLTAVIFTCNHCPYALAWHDRLLAVARDYADRDVRMLLVCPNDAERYPKDGPDAMRERVESEGPWPAPYMFDASQQVAQLRVRARRLRARRLQALHVLPGARPLLSRRRDEAGEFLRLALLTVPAGIVAATLLLWCSLQLVGT